MTGARIGFIGLGNMGGRIARRIVDSGHEVLGYDLSAEAIGAAGATDAGTVSALVSGSDVVLMSLPDSKVVERVVFGEGGLLVATRPGQVVVDLSTAAPESTRKIAARLADDGISYLDAGVSGGAAAAEKGSLTLMVGGDGAALERIDELLRSFATQIFHIGESGAGHTTKLLNNFLNAVALAATAETMVAAKAAGLDLAMVLDVFNASSGVNFATLNRFPKIITGDYLEGGLSNSLMLKDVTLYVELLGQLGVASLNSTGPIASFGLARALGYADAISNTVVDALGDISGGIRLADDKEEGRS
ncbi:NAD(P)-dependent oxidoreductase [Microbacterium sp.]|uniref:NAD(P)-dependent oxidoreductase n=1 Tax=Microbacterium sp. TaxID=51671 RepID=UPI002732DCA6|nr:NAD(P)-dependent oxidoreductase [Microbacterium sp.]MDP3951848.1 NAD(P)-dependent oxidoreductase [Microbacterium sp.]